MTLYDVYKAAVLVASEEITEYYFIQYVVDNNLDGIIDSHIPALMFACYVREQELAAHGYANAVTHEAKILKNFAA